MGDLIQKLPTDQEQLTLEEKENFRLLFGEEEQRPISQPSPISPPLRTSTVLPENPKRPTPVASSLQPSSSSMLKKEMFQVAILAGIFFLFQLPLVNSLFQTYIPLCKSDLICNVVKAIVFGIVLWVLINFKYIRQG